MPGLSLGAGAHIGAKVTPQVWGRVKLSHFMELGEDEFRQAIGQLEESPLFKRLISPDNLEDKIICRQRFPDTDLTHHCRELIEGRIAADAPFDWAALFQERQGAVQEAKKIGLENFKRFFLYAGESLSPGEIARALKITPEAVKTLRALADDFCLLDLSHPTVISSRSAAAIPDAMIASVEKKGWKFRIGYFAGHYARGHYVIDYKRLYQAKLQNRFSKGELRDIQRLITKIELINTRQTILYQILKILIETQTDYFRGSPAGRAAGPRSTGGARGGEESLKPLTQQDLARRLGVNRSTVNRAIRHKSLETPWEEQKTLRFFLINRKRFVKNILSRMKDSNGGHADEALAGIFGKNYGIKLARRTICAYRHELMTKDERRRTKDEGRKIESSIVLAKRSSIVHR
ncbi:MAG: hypothetical protein HY747_11835 [Elusimicrobia bacterium]|nr:hypothetical protein [Elusimicrobiota bacterium]